jgi:hypothetical protein
VPQNMTTFQFIVDGSTSAVTGKKMKTHTMSKKQMAPTLMNRPAAPSDHLRGGSGPLNLRSTRQVKEII